VSRPLPIDRPSWPALRCDDLIKFASGLRPSAHGGPSPAGPRLRAVVTPRYRAALPGAELRGALGRPDRQSPPRAGAVRRRRAHCGFFSPARATAHPGLQVVALERSTKTTSSSSRASGATASKAGSRRCEPRRRISRARGASALPLGLDNCSFYPHVRGGPPAHGGGRDGNPGLPARRPAGDPSGR